MKTEEISKFLKELRLNKKISQERLANDLHVDRSLISKWDANVYLKCKKYEDILYEETLLHVLCEHGIEKGYEEYYDKYGWFYDSFNCPERIKMK